MELVETDNIIFASIVQAMTWVSELWAINYSSVLPLCMLEFNGRLTDDDAILNWKTENESNTDKFVVERSINGSTITAKLVVLNQLIHPVFIPIAFTDADIYSLGTDVVYYRLKANRY